MREIYFRGKRRDNGDWSYGSLQLFKGVSIFDSIWKNFISVDPTTVGQYTGVTDKHGIKIFEGDLVRCCGEIRSVIFDERMLEFEFNSKDPVANPDGLCLCGDHAVCEVIGNIYDNPELLKGE